MRKTHVCLPALAAVLLLGAGPARLAPGVAAHAATGQLTRLIRLKQRETRRWERVMGSKPSPVRLAAGYSPRAAYRIWAGRAASVRRRALHPPHLHAWLCIHRYEGSWRDPDAPYYGGLQMDIEFQRTYGRSLLRRKGTADHWTPLEQMWVAERAYRSGRGFYPWPNTAKWCGLI